MQSEARMLELLARYPTMSRHLYGTLKYIHNKHPSLEHLRHAHAGTLSALGFREFVEAVGPGEKAIVVPTRAGEAALKLFQDSSLRERAHEMELTERTMRLLRHAKTVREIRTKSA